MKFNIRGQKLEVTESIRSYIEGKLGKLDKYFETPDSMNAHILIRVRGKEQIVEVTIPAKNVILRAEESHSDLYASIDLVLDKLERQIRKNKTKTQGKKTKNAFVDFDMSFELDKLELEEENKKIVKRKVLEMKPMSEEEAILQMELLGHQFFIFKDDDSEAVSIIYKRKDGHYGIIETK